MNSHLLQQKTEPSINQQIEQSPDLPVLPQGISHLIKTLMDDNISYEQLANELENFPAIAIKLVGMSNSAWATPINPITSLRDACSRLGLQLVRSISIALSVSQAFNPARCKLFSPEIFWASSLLTAEAAHMLAKDTQDICPETARLTGLLHNIGLLWLADKKPLETSDAIELSNNDNTSLKMVLSSKHNLNMYTIGGHLATAMELPGTTALTIASCPVNSISDIETPLIKNHHYARQLASSLLLQNKSGSAETALVDDPYFKQLEEKLSDIESMAKIFFSH